MENEKHIEKDAAGLAVALGPFAEKRSGMDRHFTQRLQPLAGLHVEMRHRREQRLEIGMLWLSEDVGDGARFHDLTAIDDDDLIRDIGDDAEIMGDDQDRHVELLLQLLEELQDLRLDGDIERGGRLVGDEQRRPADERHGDHGALTQAARQLERVHAIGALGVGEADQLQHFLGARENFRLARLEMDAIGLAHLVADRMERRERRHRLLEDHRDAPAPDEAVFVAVDIQLGEIDRLLLDRIGKQDLPLLDAAGSRQDAHDRLRDHGFAGT